MVLRNFVLLLGVILVGLGVAGPLAPNLLGLHLSLIQNTIHLVAGALALYFSSARGGAHAQAFLQASGVVFFLLALVGFLAPRFASTLLGLESTLDAEALTPDTLVHLVLGSASLIVAFVVQPVRSMPFAGLSR